MVKFHRSVEKFMSERNQEIWHRRREVEVGNLLLSNDMNNVTADNVLSFFSF